jgi:hypothetical protein
MCSQTWTHFSQNCTATIPFITQVRRFPGYKSLCLDVCMVSTKQAHLRLSDRIAVLKHPSETTIFTYRNISLKKKYSGSFTSHNTTNILVFKRSVFIQLATFKAICKPFSNNRLKSLEARTHQCITVCVHTAQDLCQI